MKSFIAAALALSCLFAPADGWSSPAPDALPQDVRPQGTTKLTVTLSGAVVSATFVTHQVHIDASKEPPRRRLNNCTYSRFPCSITDDLQIFVAGREVLIPRSAFADLGDINRGRLTRLKSGQFALHLDGGDASEGYEVTIVFDQKRVLNRTITDGESQQVTERTVYFKPSDDG
jgi:hypothetical protein